MFRLALIDLQRLRCGAILVMCLGKQDGGSAGRLFFVSVRFIFGCGRAAAAPTHVTKGRDDMRYID